MKSVLFWMKNNPWMPFVKFDQRKFFNHTYTDRSLGCIVNEKKKKEKRVLLRFLQCIYAVLFHHVARRTKTSVRSIALTIVYLSKIPTGMAPAHATVIRVKRRTKRRKHREPNQVMLLKKRHWVLALLCHDRIVGESKSTSTSTCSEIKNLHCRSKLSSTTILSCSTISLRSDAVWQRDITNTIDTHIDTEPRYDWIKSNGDTICVIPFSLPPVSNERRRLIMISLERWKKQSNNHRKHPIQRRSPGLSHWVFWV